MANVADDSKKLDDSKQKSSELTQQEYDSYVKMSRELNRHIKAYDQIKHDAELVRDAMKGMKDELADINGDLDYARKRLQDSLKELTGQDQVLKSIVKSTRTTTTLSEQLLDDREKISVMDEKQLAKLVEKAKKEQMSLFRQLELLQTKENITEEDRKQIEIIRRDLIPATESVLKDGRDRLAVEKAITKQMGLAGNAVKVLTNAMEKLGIASLLNMENINQKMRETAEQGKGRFKVLAAGLAESLKSVGEALRDPLVILTGIYKLFEGIIKSAIAFQNKVHEAAKSMGVGVQQAEHLFEKFRMIAQQNSDLAMTARQLSETYGKINDQLGIMGPQNAEFLTFANGIERRFGLSAAEMENISIYAASTGQSIQKTYGTLIATTKLNGMRLGFQMTEKQTMQAISKVSATIFNNFKGNVQQLAFAVQTATKFGTTLDQINSAGMSLLDFESSIAKEFEAQLLTGKKIDLSKARQAALTKDTAGLMREITGQLGTQAQWNNMNVLKQQSLAEAFGLSKEAVDEMYRKQQLVNALGKEANADAMTQYKLLQDQGYTKSQIVEMMGQQAVSDAMSASIQDKMAATMERVRDAIGEMTEKLVPYMEKFVDFLGNMENLKKIFSVILAITGGLVYRALVLSAKKKEEVASMAALQRQYMQQEMTATRTNVLLMRREGLISKNTAREIFGNNVRRKGAIIDATSAGSRLTAAMAYLGPAAIALGLGFISSALMNLEGGGESRASSVSIGSMSTESAAPSTGISPMNQAAAGAQSQQESLGRTVAASGNERPININFQGQVVDTALNITGRVSRGIQIDDTPYT